MASQLPVLFTVKLTVYYRCMIALHFDVCKLKMAAKMSVKYLKINFHRKIWRNLLCMPFRTHSARPFRHWLSPLIRRGCQTAFIQPLPKCYTYPYCSHIVSWPQPNTDPVAYQFTFIILFFWLEWLSQICLNTSSRNASTPSEKNVYRV
jgi:hypothetical protein